MKKLVFLLFVLSLFTTVPEVFSQTPTPTPSPFGSDIEDAISGTGRAAFVTVEISDGDVVEAIAGNIAPPKEGGFSVVGEVLSLVNNPNEHNYIDMRPFVDWLNPSFTHLMPGYFITKNPFVPFITPQIGSAHYGARLSIRGDDIEEIPFDECYLTNDNPPEKSQEIPGRKELYQNIQRLGTMWSGYIMQPNAQGTLSFDWPSTPVKRIIEADCQRQDEEELRTPHVESMTERAKFSEGAIDSSVIHTISQNILDTLGNIIDTIFAKLNVHLIARLTQKLKTDGNGFFAVAGYGFEVREIADIIASQTRTKEDGAFSTLVPFQQRKDPVGFAGTDNLIQLSGTYANDPKKYVSLEAGANRAYENMQQGACPIYPYQILAGKGPVQEPYKIGGKIPTACGAPETTLEASCPIDLIEQGKTKSQNSCNLANSGSYKSLLSNPDFIDQSGVQYADALPSGIPPLMKKVLEAAGATYNVPASMLLATMLEEGSFTHPDTWEWTDETVKQWSDCTVKDPIPSCDAFAHPQTGAKGPFGFIQNWWDQYMESGGPYKAYENDTEWKEVLTNIPNGNITQCNFVDAAFTAARELGEDQSHNYVPGLPNSCPVFGQTVNVYQGNDRPGSCGDWSPERAALARLQYGDRLCNDSVERVVKTYNDF